MTEHASLNAGHGGETHQTADADHPVLTTTHGTPISDNQNQLTAGPRGPVLLLRCALVTAHLVFSIFVLFYVVNCVSELMDHPALKST